MSRDTKSKTLRAFLGAAAAAAVALALPASALATASTEITLVSAVKTVDIVVVVEDQDPYGIYIDETISGAAAMPVQGEVEFADVPVREESTYLVKNEATGAKSEPFRIEDKGDDGFVAVFEGYSVPAERHQPIVMSFPKAPESPSGPGGTPSDPPSTTPEDPGSSPSPGEPSRPGGAAGSAGADRDSADVPGKGEFAKTGDEAPLLALGCAALAASAAAVASRRSKKGSETKGEN